MCRNIVIFIFFCLPSSMVCQRFISPIKLENSELNFREIEAFINFDVKKSVQLYERNDSLSVATLKKYSWEAFFNLLFAKDTLLIRQISQQDLNVLKYQSIWSRYYHIKSKGRTYAYGSSKNVDYKFLVEGLIDSEDLISY